MPWTWSWMVWTPSGAGWPVQRRPSAFVRVRPTAVLKIGAKSPLEYSAALFVRTCQRVFAKDRPKAGTEWDAPAFDLLIGHDPASLATCQTDQPRICQPVSQPQGHLGEESIPERKILLLVPLELQNQ